MFKLRNCNLHTVGENILGIFCLELAKNYFPGIFLEFFLKSLPRILFLEYSWIFLARNSSSWNFLGIFSHKLVRNFFWNILGFSFQESSRNVFPGIFLEFSTGLFPGIVFQEIFQEYFHFLWW